MRSLFVGRWYSYLLVALVIVPLVAVYAYQDDLTVVFNNWSSGEPKIMVKLEIHIPSVNAEYCGVAVLRLPSLYRPTKTGFSKEIYRGKHRPGETIVVKELLAAIVAKTKIEEGEYKVEYYEPVEYFVAVACMRGNETTHKYAKIHEIYPNKLITTQRIEVELKEQQTSRVSEESVGSYETNPLACNLQQISPPLGALDAAECYTWVRGPYIYSLSGLKVSFGLQDDPPSAVYLESYGDLASCVLDYCDHDIPQWSSAGKKLAYSVVLHETVGLTGRWKDRVYFRVRYVYEKWYVSFDGFAGIGMLVWLLYPEEIGGLERSEFVSGVPYEKQYRSIIPPAPYYAYGPLIGDYRVRFLQPYESDTVLTSITISFSYGVGGWSVSLSVGFYKAGRNDRYYTTPYVMIRDTSGSTQPWYYWWYRDNDKMTYEVITSNYG